MHKWCRPELLQKGRSPPPVPLRKEKGAPHKNDSWIYKPCWFSSSRKRAKCDRLTKSPCTWVWFCRKRQEAKKNVKHFPTQGWPSGDQPWTSTHDVNIWDTLRRTFWVLRLEIERTERWGTESDHTRQAFQVFLFFYFFISPETRQFSAPQQSYNDSFGFFKHFSADCSIHRW